MEIGVFKSTIAGPYEDEEEMPLYSLVRHGMIIKYYSDGDLNHHVDATPVKHNLSRKDLGKELEPKKAIKVCRKILEIIIRFQLGVTYVRSGSSIILSTFGYKVEDIQKEILEQITSQKDLLSY